MVRGLVEDSPALLDVVAVQPDHERFGGIGPEHRQCLHDSRRHLVAGGDPTEDVDEHALHARVTENDAQAVGHHLRRSTAADVEEVRRLHPAVLLAGVRHHVQRAHDQPGAVADDAHRTVEFDVVQSLGHRLALQRVYGAGVVEVGELRVPEVGIPVEGDLAVQSDDRAGRILHERVDLDQGGVGTGEDRPQLLRHVDDLVGNGFRKPRSRHDLPCLGLVHSGPGVDRDSGQGLRIVDGDLLDLDPTLHRGHRQERAVGPVEQVGEVVLLRNVAGLRDEHAVHGVPLDVHPQHVPGLGLGPGRVVGEFHTTGLPAAAGLHLRLDDDPTADRLCGRTGLLRRRGHRPTQHRYAVLGEQVPRLVLEQVHGIPSVTTVLPRPTGYSLGAD